MGGAGEGQPCRWAGARWAGARVGWGRGSVELLAVSSGVQTVPGGCWRVEECDRESAEPGKIGVSQGSDRAGQGWAGQGAIGLGGDGVGLGSLGPGRDGTGSFP